MSTVQPKELKQLFRERLRKLRTDAGMTQTDLAKKINVHQPYIAALESGEGSPNLETIAKLSEALEISPRELMPK